MVQFCHETDTPKSACILSILSTNLIKFIDEFLEYCKGCDFGRNWGPGNVFGCGAYHTCSDCRSTYDMFQNFECPVVFWHPPSDIICFLEGAYGKEFVKSWAIIHQFCWRNNRPPFQPGNRIPWQWKKNLDRDWKLSSESVKSYRNLQNSVQNCQIIVNAYSRKDSMRAYTPVA